MGRDFLAADDVPVLRDRFLGKRRPPADSAWWQHTWPRQTWANSSLQHLAAEHFGGMRSCVVLLAAFCMGTRTPIFAWLNS